MLVLVHKGAIDSYSGNLKTGFNLTFSDPVTSDNKVLLTIANTSGGTIPVTAIFKFYCGIGDESTSTNGIKSISYSIV